MARGHGGNQAAETVRNSRGAGMTPSGDADESTGTDPAWEAQSKSDEKTGKMSAAVSGSESARSMQSQGSTPGTVPLRTTGSVSMWKLSTAAGNTTAPVSLTNVANSRGIEGAFALRELITPQTVDDTHLSSLRGSEGTWQNWLKDYASDSQPYRPDTVDDVRQIVLSSARNGQKVRAVGAGHSHSKAASPDENYLVLYRYTNGSAEGLVGSPDTRDHISNPKDNATHYDPPPGTHTTKQELDVVRVEAGAMLKYLNRDVLKNETGEFSEGVGLLNMGAFDEQTISGAINTGTHGTGRNLGTLSDSVLSVEMATVMESPARGTPIVRMFRIEPEDGITDRTAFESKVDKHGMALIQDDDIFHSVVVGYGAMGVATSYTLKVRKNYFLKEYTDVKQWSDLRGDPDTQTGPQKGVIWEKLQDPAVRHFQFFVNVPATDGPTPETDPKCMVRWHEKEQWKDQPNNSPPNWPPRRKSNASQDIGRWLRKATSGSGVDPTTPNPVLPALINEYFDTQAETGFKDYGISAQRRDSAWYVALRRRPDKHFATPQKPPDDPLPAMTTEVAVPVNQVEEAVQTVIDTVQTVNENKELHFMAPAGIRFVAGSDHYLSAEYDDPSGKRSNGVAMVELPFTVGPVRKTRANAVALAVLGVLGGALMSFATALNLAPTQNFSQQEMLRLSKQALEPVEEALINDHDGRPHMGKHNSLDYQTLSNMYGRLSTWEKVNEQFNAFGTFDNKFTRNLGLDQDS
jgi:hypothetical protein